MTCGCAKEINPKLANNANLWKFCLLTKILLGYLCSPSIDVHIYEYTGINYSQQMHNVKNLFQQFLQFRAWKKRYSTSD
jgi:hypothetical protein